MGFDHSWGQQAFDSSTLKLTELSTRGQEVGAQPLEKFQGLGEWGSIKPQAHAWSHMQSP